MCGGDCDGVDAFGDEAVDVADDARLIEFAVGFAVCGDGGTAAEAEVFVAGGFDGLLLFGVDALDVGEGEEAAELVLVVDDE